MSHFETDPRRAAATEVAERGNEPPAGNRNDIDNQYY
jgi:hypothetical protein